MTYRSPRLSNNDGAVFAAVGCLGCFVYFVYLLCVLAFIGAVAWVVIYVAQSQGVL